MNISPGHLRHQQFKENPKKHKYSLFKHPTTLECTTVTSSSHSKKYYFVNANNEKATRKHIEKILNRYVHNRTYKKPSLKHTKNLLLTITYETGHIKKALQKSNPEVANFR